MKISVILAHPNPGSFNHAIGAAVIQALGENRHDIVYHDLYAERFNPVLPFEEIPRGALLDPVIQAHCAEIAAAEGIVVIHPDWWGQPPAILKGWVDRVLRPGVAYRFLEGDRGEGVPVGLLKAKAALVFKHLQHPPGAGDGGLWRPARAALEGLHLLALRCSRHPQADVLRCGDEHG